MYLLAVLRAEAAKPNSSWVKGPSAIFMAMAPAEPPENQLRGSTLAICDGIVRLRSQQREIETENRWCVTQVMHI